MAQRKFVYSWTKRYGASAQKVGQWFYSLPDRSPENMVAEARNRGSPVHKLFDWDDRSAAHTQRLHQARQIIASLHVEVRITQSDRKPVHVRAFIGASDRVGYVATLEANEEELTRAEQRCLDEMARMRTRWKGFQLARTVVSAIDHVRASASRKRKGERRASV